MDLIQSTYKIRVIIPKKAPIIGLLIQSFFFHRTHFNGYYVIMYNALCVIQVFYMYIKRELIIHQYKQN